MIIAALTGSIAMGKSTVAQMFADLGWPVFDADRAVREFYSSVGALLVERAFPGVVVDGTVDRALLSAKVLNNDRAMAELEAIVHPAVQRMRVAFLRNAAGERRRGVILDIPLLFETGGDAAVDMVVVASASMEAQRARALARLGMTLEKFHAIVLRQLPDAEKRRRAHYVINTDGAIETSRRQVEGFARAVVGAPGRSKGFGTDA